MDNKKLWACMAKEVLFSKELTPGEKVLWAMLDFYKEDKMHSLEIPRKKLAAKMGLNIKTISAMTDSMKEKGFLGKCKNDHSHYNWYYPTIPKEPESWDDSKPSKEVLDRKRAIMLEVNNMLFGTVDLNRLAGLFMSLLNQKPQISHTPLNETQKNFVNKFHEKFPKKPINCNVADYPAFDYDGLIKAIEKSDFLPKANNLNLKWCIEHCDEILAGGWEKWQNRKENFKGRSYSDLDIGDFFTGIDDIEI